MKTELVMSSRQTVDGYLATISRKGKRWVVSDYDHEETKHVSFAEAVNKLKEVMEAAKVGQGIMFYGYNTSDQI